MDKVVVLYIRLSKADDDVEEKGESNSISTQRQLLNSFLDKHPDLSYYPRFEAIDDGFSGTNGNRPMLRKSIEMAENGKVVAFCCKDTSRFYRNHHHAGRYIDKLFPLWNVRYISLGDSYDSNDYVGITADIGQAMKNIIYAQYPIMLSKATVTAKVQKMKQGKYVGNQPPYGYLLNPNVRNTFIVDQEVAHIVKRIFESIVSGIKVSNIAIELNSEKVPSPSQHFKKNNPDSKKFVKSVINENWNYGTIYRIASNYAYTGAMVSHRRKTYEVGNRQSKPNEPIIVENTHEAIVSKSQFEQVQQRIKKGGYGKKNVRDYPLRGLIRCGMCRKSLVKNKKNDSTATFHCTTPRYDKGFGCTKDFRWLEKEIEEIVFRAILDKLAPVMEEYKEMQKQTTFPSTKTLPPPSLTDYNKQKKDLMAKKMMDYENFTNGGITKESFLVKKEAINLQLLSLEEKITAAQNQIVSDIVPEKQENLDVVDLELHENILPEKLTSHLAKSFIKAIYLYENNKVEIVFLFQE